MQSKYRSCKNGLPHSLITIAELPTALYERCEVCGRRWRWNITPKTRTDNHRYLKVHQRDFVQPTGRTAKIFHKLFGEAENPLVNTHHL